VEERVGKIVPPWVRSRPPGLVIRTVFTRSSAGKAGEESEKEKIATTVSRFQDQVRRHLTQLATVAGPDPTLFTSGFESGATDGWTAQTPEVPAPPESP
jgi:hypothetical protein